MCKKGTHLCLSFELTSFKASHPITDTLGDGKIESAAEVGPELIPVGEDSRTAILRLAEPGSSVTVKNKNGQIEYAG